MKRILASCAALMLCIALSATAAQAAKSRQNVTNLTFATYVWQPTTVKAMNGIVASWNKSHPSIQVSIVPVDVNSVHDKLLTSFVGGTAADIVHDEAADIPGFTQQGYLANLTPLMPDDLKQAIPKSIWDTVNFGGKITGVPIMLQTYNVFANMDVLKAAGIKAPTVNAPWTWDQFRQNAKKLSTNGNFGVCWGLRSPTAHDPDAVAELGRSVELPREGPLGAQLRPGRAEDRDDHARHGLQPTSRSTRPASASPAPPSCPRSSAASAP